MPSERCSIQKQSIVYCGFVCVVRVCTTSLDNMPIHNILSTAPQLSVSQKALRMLPEEGNVIPKHIGATIHN